MRGVLLFLLNKQNEILSLRESGFGLRQPRLLIVAEIGQDLAGQPAEGLIQRTPGEKETLAVLSATSDEIQKQMIFLSYLINRSFGTSDHVFFFLIRISNVNFRSPHRTMMSYFWCFFGTTSYKHKRHAKQKTTQTQAKEFEKVFKTKQFRKNLFKKKRCSSQKKKKTSKKHPSSSPQKRLNSLGIFHVVAIPATRGVVTLRGLGDDLDVDWERPRPFGGWQIIEIQDRGKKHPFESMKFRSFAFIPQIENLLRHLICCLIGNTDLSG